MPRFWRLRAGQALGRPRHRLIPEPAFPPTPSPPPRGSHTQDHHPPALITPYGGQGRDSWGQPCVQSPVVTQASQAPGCSAASPTSSWETPLGALTHAPHTRAPDQRWCLPGCPAPGISPPPLGICKCNQLPSQQHLWSVGSTYLNDDKTHVRHPAACPSPAAASLAVQVGPPPCACPLLQGESVPMATQQQSPAPLL